MERKTLNKKIKKIMYFFEVKRRLENIIMKKKKKNEYNRIQIRIENKNKRMIKRHV